MPNHSKYPKINDQINQFKGSLELYKTKIGLEPMDEQSFEYIENFIKSISKNIKMKDNPNGIMYDLYWSVLIYMFKDLSFQRWTSAFAGATTLEESTQEGSAVRNTR